MKRGDIYRVFKGNPREAKNYRLFAVISREPLIASKHSTVICAPIYTVQHGLSTQVPLTPQDGVKSDCAIHCDELMSLPKSLLSDFVANLNPAKTASLNRALAIATGLV